MPLKESVHKDSASNSVTATRRLPSSAVPEKPKHRIYTPEYKMRIVEAADACTQPGEVGALLRREGLYSSHLVNWRRQYRTGAAEKLSRQRRGPKGKDLLVLQKEELERQVARLQQRLGQAERIIEVQKKVSELLGIPFSEERHP